MFQCILDETDGNEQGLVRMFRLRDRRRPRPLWFWSVCLSCIKGGVGGRPAGDYTVVGGWTMQSRGGRLLVMGAGSPRKLKH